ncbi:MAG TPA: hypothetical protein VE133_06180, partial [Candidatus Sulfotelmatobacter sp.]|nr:hypothetical protein [Candidatus Sulfotelmatobacter sp.]
ESPAPMEVEAEPSVQEFSFDAPDIVVARPEPIAAIPVEPVIAEPALPEITVEPVRLEAALVAVTPPPAPAHEIDISNEWEEMIEVEPAAATPELQVEPLHQIEEEPPVRLAEAELEPAAPRAAEKDLNSQVADKIQEIHFYINQEMWDSAKSAILDLTEIAPDAPEVTQLIAAVNAGQSKGARSAKPGATPVFIDEPVAAAPAEIPVEISESEIVEPLPPPPPPPPSPKPEPGRQAKHVPIKEPAFASTEDDLLEIAEPPKVRPAAPQPAVSARGKSTEDILGDFVLELEQSGELADFVPKQHASPTPEPAPAVAAAPAMERRSFASKANGDMQDAESANVLSDILSELQEETAEAAAPEEDTETHYNLGIAFKEMGLLDEAIGELQKVCHAVDRGSSFSQPIQALTWLAQCLVDKGAPEAAVRWYQKALELPGLDNGGRCAIYYDLAMAYEASGDKKSALVNFMEVYGSNIDFRDVASRIKALKS